MFEPVVIETRRTRLRPLQRDDASVFFEVWSDPEVAHYFSFPPMQDIFQAHQRVTEKLRSSSEGKGIIFVVESNDSGEVLGDCGLHNADWRCRHAEIGFCLARSHWGKGYMTEAAQALIDYGFREAGLRRIEANIDPRNRPSVMLVERIGFKLEGYLRERWVTGAGEVSDILLYGLIQGDRQR